jgi:DNA-binding response OmpR family regulator
MKILVLDNDRDLAEMLCSWLKTLGHQVRYATTWEQGKTEWIGQRPELVIMDTALEAGVDGLEMFRNLRSKHDALVVVITESASIRDEIQCLNSGADDYIRKPFFPAQLEARIRAISRRERRSILEEYPSSILTVGPIRLDALQNEVSIHGRTTRLTPIESKLLHLLAVNANNVCTAEQIVTHLWGYGGGKADLIKAHIRHLRQKIEPNPGEPHYILTVPGVGYTLVRRQDERINPAIEATPAIPNIVNN